MEDGDTRLRPSIVFRAMGGMAKMAPASMPATGPNPKSKRIGTR